MVDRAILDFFREQRRALGFQQRDADSDLGPRKSQKVYLNDVDPTQKRELVRLEGEVVVSDTVALTPEGDQTLFGRLIEHGVLEKFQHNSVRG